MRHHPLLPPPGPHRTPSELAHHKDTLCKRLREDQLQYEVAFVVGPELRALSGVVVNLQNSETDVTDPNFEGNIKVGRCRAVQGSGAACGGQYCPALEH